MAPLRLLLIDDDQVDRMAITRLLRQTRLDVAVGECAERASALPLLQSGNFDCVLLDYYIPGTDGLEILKEIRRQGQWVPVIVLTGQGDEAVAVELMKAGAADYLNKNGLTAERLERSIRYAMALHRADQERQELLERERRAREEAQAANRAKDEFLATLSHELRTPLNAILGWSRLLMSGSLNAATATRAIEIINRNTRLQSQLIEDLLDISRIITGKLRLDLRAVPAASIVESALESVRPTADVRHLTLDVDLDAGAVPILCDAARMQQVIWNLLSNAIKFTPEGGRISVSVQREGDTVTIIVADTGTGIEPGFLPYVFDRFRQQDAASTRVHGGLGLGLSIVRHLVELHGGTVEARSEGPGQGSMFLVRVPVAPKRAQQVAVLEAETSRENLGSMPSLAGIRVLVVDNEPDARGLLRTVLENCGADVDEAESAAEALESVISRRPDVLLSDIAMPREDGYSLIGRIRALEEPVRLLPAAALTAHATAADRTRALLAGYTAHVAKPVDPAELAAVVAALAGRTALKS